MRIPRIVLLMLVVSACGRAPERSEDVDSQSSALLDYNVTIPLPADVPASAVALWANSRLDVADRATLSGATGCGFALVNEGALETNLGVESRTPSTWSHAPILVRDRAQAGSLRGASSISLGNDVVVSGSVVPNSPFASTSTLSWSVTFPATTGGDVLLEPGQYREIDPGRWEKLSVKTGATVRLRSGTYYFESWDVIEPGSTLLLDEGAGPIDINVRSGLTFRGAIQAASGGTPDPLVTYLGSNTAFVEAPFTGSLVAPNASIVLATVSGVHTGAFFGNGVEVRPDTVVVHRPLRQPGVSTASSTTCSVRIPVPSELGLEEVAMLGASGVTIGAGATVVDAPSGLSPVINAGTTALDIGAGARVGAVWSVGPVSLGSNSVLGGYLVTAGQATAASGGIDAHVTGEALQNRAIALRNYDWSIEFPRTVADNVVVTTGTQVLPPGTYRDVRVATGAELTLQSGKYFAESFSVEAGATVRLANPAQQTNIYVRSTLAYAGSVVDGGGSPIQPADLIVTFFGTGQVRIDGPFSGTLIAMDARVLLGVAALSHEGALYARAIEFIAGRFRHRPSPPRLGTVELAVEPSRLPTTERFFPIMLAGGIDPRLGMLGPNDIRLPGGQAPVGVGLQQNDPVEVWSDNPTYYGSFLLGSGESGTANGEYSTSFTWTGTPSLEPLLAQTRHALGNPSMASVALPFPGFMQTGPGLADWRSRTGMLIHDTVFQASRTVFRGANVTPPHHDLWVRLADEVLLVPVVVVSFIHPTMDPASEEGQLHRRQTHAMFDFVPPIASDDPAAYVRGAPFSDPTLPEIPPDDIWAQCGIQFQVVESYVFHLPEDPFIPPCSTHSDTREFVTDQDLLDNFIGPAQGQQHRDQLEELAPIWYQIGDLSLCSNSGVFTGKTGPTGDHGPVVQIDVVRHHGNLSAHELGHALLGSGHLEVEGNLMRAGAEFERQLSPSQCRQARQAAKARSDRYARYTRPDLAQQLPELTDFPPAPQTTFQPPIACCDTGSGSFRDMLLASCTHAGGQPVSGENCNVCCDVNGAALRVRSFECAGSARLPDGDCDLICCQLPSGNRSQQTRHACNQAGGTEFPGTCFGEPE